MQRAAIACSTSQRSASLPSRCAEPLDGGSRAGEFELRVAAAGRASAARRATTPVAARVDQKSPIEPSSQRAGTSMCVASAAHGTVVLTPVRRTTSPRLLGARRGRERIARLELGERGGQDALAARDLRQPRALAIFAAEARERQRAEHERREGGNGRHATPDLLEQETERQEAEVGSAVLLGDRDTEQIGLRERLPQGRVPGRASRLVLAQAFVASRDPRGSCAPARRPPARLRESRSPRLSPCSGACRGRPSR